MAKVIKPSQAGSPTFPHYVRDTLEAVMPYVVEDDGPQDPVKILAHARAEAGRIMEEAYKEGLERGKGASRAEFEEQVAASAEALRAAAESMKQARDAFLAALEPQVVELAVAIAGRILRREAVADKNLILSTVRASLEKLVERERLVIRLNPRDEQAVREQKLSLLEEFDGMQHIDVVADASVSLGGCIVDSGTTHLDGQLESQLQHILDTLLE